MESSAAPFYPPASPKQMRDWVQLIRSRRVGPATFLRLMADHGTASAALDALPEIAREAGVKSYSICPDTVAAAELERGAKFGATPLFLGQDDYPDTLAALKDPPPFLWSLGDRNLLNKPILAIVGARNASSLGLRFARKLARDLGEKGFVIVSGLARGIDACVHESCFETGTIGVQAGGLDVVYPRETDQIHARMATEGLRLAENPFGTHPQARHFPQRNRIVAGLAKGIIVIEGAARSGSLITARAAADLGRDVLAVPGHPMDGRSAGSNSLLRDGATLVRHVDDVIETVGLPSPKTAPPSQSSMPFPPKAPPDIAKKILDHLAVQAISEDHLIRDTGIASALVTSEITRLELLGEIERHPGGLLAKTE